MAGLAEELKFHSLRHTFATWLIQESASLYELQKLLGHSDIKTTQMYAHLSASDLHATVNRISLG
jgi:site-specific recombinase XerD